MRRIPKVNRQLSASLCVCLMFAVGCGGASDGPPAGPMGPPKPATSSESQLPLESAEAVAAIEFLTKKIRRDGDGLIVEVDFRGDRKSVV